MWLSSSDPIPCKAAPATVLTGAATRMVEFFLSDFGMRVFRICVAESDRFPELGREFYRNGPALARAHIGLAMGAAGTATALEAADVPSGKIYTVADIAADPHYAARGMLQTVHMDDGSDLLVPGFVPRLSATPCSHRRNAPALGQDTDAVLREAGLTEAQIATLRERGVVA